MEINVYRVDIYKNDIRRNSFDVTVEHIACENDTYIVLGDHNFTKLRKKSDRSDHDTTLEKPIIYERNWGITSLDGLSYVLYTEKTKRPETIKSEINAFLDKKYGWLFRVNLDFIK